MEANAKYAKHITKDVDINANKQSLRMIGATEQQVNDLAPRPFEALPLWARRAFKKLQKRQNIKWAKLQPRQGERAFYITKERLPRGPVGVSATKVAQDVLAGRHGDLS